MSIVYGVLHFLLFAFTLMLWARLVFDWARVLRPGWRPRGVVLFLADVVYTITDPPLRWIRSVVKPINLGGASIDLSWTVALLVVYLLSAFIPSPVAL